MLTLSGFHCTLLVTQRHMGEIKAHKVDYPRRSKVPTQNASDTFSSTIFYRDCLATEPACSLCVKHGLYSVAAGELLHSRIGADELQWCRDGLVLAISTPVSVLRGGVGIVSQDCQLCETQPRKHTAVQGILQ